MMLIRNVNILKTITLLIVCQLLLTPYAQAINIISGRKAVTAAGTAETLGSGAAICNRIILTAFEANTDAVVIGDSTVDATEATRTGLTLFAGQTEYLEGARSIAITYIDSEVSSEGVAWVCLGR